MRVLLDGLNLSLRQGTGIATYAYNLAHTLTRSGVDVGILYSQYPRRSLKGFFAPRTNFPLIQDLALGNEGYLPQGMLRKLETLASVPMGSLGKGPLARPIQGLDLVEWRSVAHKIPEGVSLHNIPSLYHRAFARVYLTGGLQRFRCPPGFDAFHATTFIPIIASNAMNVCTAHDVIPLKLPGTTTVNLDAYHAMVASILSRYDRILTVSNVSKQDLVELFGCSESKITVTYQHVSLADSSEQMSDASIAAYLSGVDLQVGRFLLCVGAIEPKKNLPRMIKAYAESSLTMPLVIVGKDGWQTEESMNALAPLLATTLAQHRRLQGHKHILRLKYVSKRELISLYRGAMALMFCSLYEGFGLPVLEAMSLGCPVIASNNSSIPEIAGDAALLVDPYDVGAMSQAINTMHNDSSLRDELRGRGLAQAQKFSERTHASVLASVY